jgi:excisionase family DNA binding protein
VLGAILSKTKMSEKKRHTVTTIETHETWIVRRPATESTAIVCAACPGERRMLTPKQAAEEAGVTNRTVYRWVDEGVIHFLETEEGNLFVCLAPLTIDVG